MFSAALFDVTERRIRTARRVRTAGAVPRGARQLRARTEAGEGSKTLKEGIDKLLPRGLIGYEPCASRGVEGLQ